MALNTGINSLDAGAPKLRLEGERTAELDAKQLWEKMMLENYVPTPEEKQLIQQYLQMMSRAKGQQGVMAAQGGRIGYDTGGNIRQRPHQSKDLLVQKTSSGERPKYQPPSQGGGFADTGSSGGGGGGGGGWQSYAIPAAPTVSTTAAHEDIGATTTIAELERAIEDAAKTDLVSPIGPVITPETRLTAEQLTE